jgi:CheY-like chemotaxis protein
MRHPTVSQSVQGTDWKKVRVLVFGRDDQFRFLARQTFRRLNVREVTSFDQLADLGKLVGQGFDILLIDLAVDPEDGLRVLEGVRRPPDNPNGALPVLAVAPPSLKAMVERARVLGIEGVVPKPISGHELGHRVGETLARPERMAPPDRPAEAPKRNFVKEADPLPEMGGGEASPSAPASGSGVGAIPEVAALMARLEARVAGGVASPNDPRPSRGGPAAALGVKPAEPAPRSAAPVAAPVSAPKSASGPAAAAAPPPSSPPPSSPPPSRRSPAEFVAAGADAPSRRPSGGRLGDDDLAPARKVSNGAIEVAGLRPDPDAEEARRRAARRRKEWEDAMAQAGHKARKGRDVAALDVSAVVAEHARWLETKAAEGKRATFTGMDLAGVDLSGALLANATFRQVELSDACLAEARLDGSDFRHAVLSAADLGGANLGVATLRHARLDLSNLEGAVLRGCDLSGARLCGSRTAGADFKGANLMGADLRDADLSRVENLTQAQVDKALCDKGTRLPPGIFRPLADSERLS